MLKWLKTWWKEYKLDMCGNFNAEAWAGEGPEWKKCPQCLGYRSIMTMYLISACPICEGNGHVKTGSYKNYKRV